MSTLLTSPSEVMKQLAKQVQTKRLSMNWSQQALAKHSGVSFGVIKKFERTGKISLESLLYIALALGSLHEFESLFTTSEKQPSSLDALLNKKIRQRGRT